MNFLKGLIIGFAIGILSGVYFHNEITSFFEKSLKKSQENVSNKIENTKKLVINKSKEIIEQVKWKFLFFYFFFQ